MEAMTLVLEDIRSAHNVGAILRSAAAFGIESVAVVGLTPYPPMPDDQRLPHIARRAHRAIAKTALGAEELVSVTHYPDIYTFRTHYSGPLYVLEQTPSATSLHTFTPDLPCAIVLGHETNGTSSAAREIAKKHVGIPHTERKHSLNVATAAGILLHTCYTRLDHRS